MALPDKFLPFLARLPRLRPTRRWRKHYGKAFALRCGDAPSERLRADLAESLSAAKRPAARGLRTEALSIAIALALAPAGSGANAAPPLKAAEGKAGALLKTVRRALKAAFRFLNAAVRIVLYAHIVFILSTSLLVILYSGMDPGATVLMGYRKFANHHSLKRPVPVKIKEISRYRRDILIRVEDWTFYSHSGFELAAIKNAALINKRIGRPLYGGSTLSMQTARTLFLVPFKSYFRKYLEAIITVELELFLSKNRILELYYSYAEWGKGIFGIQAASQAYYGVPVSGISDEQYIRLVSLLSSPVRYNPTTLFKNNLLAWRYNFLMGRFLPATADAKAEAALATDAAAQDPAASEAPAEKSSPAENSPPSSSASPSPSADPQPIQTLTDSMAQEPNG